jgi:cytochrome c-type biogenesis protein CcmH/NrfG
VRRQPTFPNAYYNLGVAQLKLGRRWDAVASFETALDLQPNDAKAKIGLAQAAGAGFSGRDAIHLPLS